MNKRIIPFILAPLFLLGCAKAIANSGPTICADGEVQLPRYADGASISEGLSLHYGSESITPVYNNWLIRTSSPWSTLTVNTLSDTVNIGGPLSATVMGTSKSNVSIFDEHGKPVVEYPGQKGMSARIGTIRPMYDTGVQGLNVLTKQEYIDRVIRNEIIQCFTQTFP
jgi:hypothetical protein